MLDHVWRTKPPLGWPIDASHPLVPGLAHAWLFNEGAGFTAFNAVNPAFNATSNTNTAADSSWVASPYGPALAHTATHNSNGLILPSIATGTTFTFATWVLTTNTGAGYQNLLAAGSGHGFWIYTGKLDLYNCGTSATAIGNNTWVNWVCSVNNGSIQFYLNGVPDGTGIGSWTSQNFNGMLCDNVTNGVEQLQGTIAQQYLWLGRALTAAEAASLYANPWPFFLPPRTKAFRSGSSPVTYIYGCDGGSAADRHLSSLLDGGSASEAEASWLSGSLFGADSGFGLGLSIGYPMDGDDPLSGGGGGYVGGTGFKVFEIALPILLPRDSSTAAENASGAILGGETATADSGVLGSPLAGDSGAESEAWLATITSTATTYSADSASAAEASFAVSLGGEAGAASSSSWTSGTLVAADIAIEAEASLPALIGGDVGIELDSWLATVVSAAAVYGTDGGSGASTQVLWLLGGDSGQTASSAWRSGTVYGCDGGSGSEPGSPIACLIAADAAAEYDADLLISVTFGYYIYSNTGAGDPINYASPIATIIGFTTTTWTSSPLPDGTWSFGVRAYNAYGIEGNLDVACTVTILSGMDVSDIPLPPATLSAIGQAGGSIRVEWAYPLGQSRTKAPTGFHVYQGTGGVVNYSTPVATVAAGSGGLTTLYSATISGLADGTAYTFGVRAFNSFGEESNTLTTSATAKASGPSAVVGLTISAVP